jgi:tetratricopeptide (TPR) repeat protein
MRILIADDSSSVAPQAAPPPAARTGAAKMRGDVGEPVTMSYELGRRAAAVGVASPTGALDADGCPPQPPIPPCPPLDLQDQPEHLACALDALGLALLNRGCLNEGRRLIELAYQIRLAHFGKDHPLTAASRMSRARAMRMFDELIAAEKEIEAAIKVNKKVYGGRSYPLALNLNERGAIELYAGKFADALKSARAGQKILYKLRLSATDPNWTRLLDIEGRALVALDKVSEGDKVLRAAVAIDKKQVGDHHPKYASHLANLAVAEEMRGDLSAAQAHIEEAIKVYDNDLGLPAHQNLIDMYANLGSVQTRRQDFERAKASLCKALGLNKQLRGEKHTLVGNDHANLGRLYYATGDLPAAKAQFETALRIYKANVPVNMPRRHPYIREAEIWLDRIKRGAKEAR